MPYEIRKTEKGWKVFTKGTNNPHSDAPMSLARAKDQMKALYANTDDIKKEGGSNLLARTLFPTMSMAYDMATGKNIFTGNGRMIGGFDDDDFETLFGGAEDDDDLNQKPQDDSEAIIKLDKSEFDAEEATGEPEYLKQAKAFAKKAGYKDYNSLQLARDGKHKLMLRGVKFGSIKNNDYIIYKQHYASVADKKRRAYLARATRIKGDWAKDRYSPNSLAINILWDGSSKKGGDGDIDWWKVAGDLASQVVKDLPGTLVDSFGTAEMKEKKRLKDEACKLCNGSGLSGGADKKMNYRKDGDYKDNWGYDEDAYLDDKGKKISKEEYEKQFTSPPAPEEPAPPPQPLFGDPSQFQPQAYDPNNPLMYMVGAGLLDDLKDGMNRNTALTNILGKAGNAILDKTYDYITGGAVPLNKKLYERAKEIVYPRYKKPSAYRSGAVVKMYKDMGGKFKDSNGRPLARWFKEEWKDVGNKEYPVYRPTKRISKDTPLTVSEIDPENLRLQIAEKQKIKGDKNLGKFEGGICKKTGKAPCLCGGRLDPDKAKAQEIFDKVASNSNPKVRQIEATPMGDNNIRKYFPNAKILKYSELADIKDISQLLPQPKSFFFLLYEHSLNSGHWTVVNRYIDNGRDTICFFCSYGSVIDGPLRWNSQSTNQQLGQDKPYLSILLQKSGKRLVYNKVQYQSKQSAIATCGAFDVLWIKANIRDGMTLQDFHEWIAEIKKETGLSYDEIVANAISNRAS